MIPWLEDIWSSITNPMSLGLLNSDSRLDPGLDEPELLLLEGPLPPTPDPGTP